MVNMVACMGREVFCHPRKTIIWSFFVSAPAVQKKLSYFLWQQKKKLLFSPQMEGELDLSNKMDPM